MGNVDGSDGRTGDQRPPTAKRAATLSRLAYKFVAERRARGEISRGTAEQYESRLLSFAEITKVEPHEVRRRHVVKWMERPEISVSYRRARLVALRSFCQWCVLNGHMPHDPTLGVKPPKLPPLLPRNLSLEESVALMAAATQDHPRTVLACSLMLQEGLRRSEVAGIQLGDLDRAKRTLSVRGKGGGGGITRRLPITDETWRALVAYLPMVPGASGPLLRSLRWPERGISGPTVGDLVTRAMRAAGVKHYAWDGRSAHALRHTCAQDLVDLEVDLRKVQKVLGHASIKNTELYTRGAVTGLREVMAGRTYRDAVPVTTEAS